jgi:hypothetical protein
MNVETYEATVFRLLDKTGKSYDMVEVPFAQVPQGSKPIQSVGDRLDHF